MNENNYLKILGIVTVGLIGVGILRNVVLPLFGTGALTASVNYDDMADFTQIEADLETASLTILAGERVSVSVDTHREKEPVIAVREGILTITQKESGGWNLLHFTGTKKCEITITLPADQLTRIKITSDVGSIRVEGLSLKQLEIQTDVGEVKLSDVEADSLETETSVGAISLERTAGNDCYLKSDVGTITARMRGKADDYAKTLSTDLGHVNLNGASVSKDYREDVSGAAKRITAKTDVGTIHLSFEE